MPKTEYDVKIEKPNPPSLGSGLAEMARQILLGRRKKIEEEIKKATK